MNRRNLILSIVGFLVVVGSIFTFDLVRQRTPVLGLDLRGGLSIIYAPEQQADASDLVFVRDMMRSSLEDQGIAEPDVRVEGQNIIADLPGVSDQESAFDALNISGIVELRPVMQCVAAAPDPGTVSATGETVPATTIDLPDAITGENRTDSSTPGTATPGETAPGSTTPGATTPATAVPGSGASVPAATAPTGTGEVTQEGKATGPMGFSRPLVATATTGPISPEATTPQGTAAPTSPATSVPSGSVPGSTPAEGSTPANGSGPTPVIASVPADGSTPTAPTIPEGQDILPYPAALQQCLVGPSGGDGGVFEKDAQAGVDQEGGGGWLVTVSLKRDGEAVWNRIAGECYNATPTCPSKQMAIVLDGEIQSAPTVNAPTFQGSVQISGSFTQEEADQLAGVLNRGAFPVRMIPQRTETVSPSAGQDSLNAAIFAGLAGVLLMLFTMVIYYRSLSVIMITGLMIWGVTVFTLATLVSRATNYALTLAGATGIIIAVGVTVDTYVVFFERIRDELRAGRSLANAAPRSYRLTGRTVVSADVISLIASIILFSLSVGSVKGFALYLGLTTVSDLLVFYFFTRPAVLLLGRSRWGRRTAKSRRAAVAGASA